MKRIGFWETFFDDNISWREAAAINEAHDSISLMQQASASNDAYQAEQLQKLFALDRAQARQIERMAATIDVLTELLLESGALETAALTERINARIESIEAARAEAEAKGEVEVPKVQCQRCFQVVAARDTQITSSGTVCDRCYYSG